MGNRVPRESAATIAEWTEQARRDMPPGATVYTILRNVSASGMTRAIDVYTIEPEDDRTGRIVKRWHSYRVAAILGYPMSDRWDAVSVGGAGMDMGFHLIYSLSSRLYPDGFDCTGEHCPSNDHTNGSARPHEYRPGSDNPADDPGCAQYDRGMPNDRCGRSRAQHPTLPRHHGSGGYALRQEWL